MPVVIKCRKLISWQVKLRERKICDILQAFTSRKIMALEIYVKDTWVFRFLYPWWKKIFRSSLACDWDSCHCHVIWKVVSSYEGLSIQNEDLFYFAVKLCCLITFLHGMNLESPQSCLITDKLSTWHKNWVNEITCATKQKNPHLRSHDIFNVNQFTEKHKTNRR